MQIFKGQPPPPPSPTCIAPKDVSRHVLFSEFPPKMVSSTVYKTSLTYRRNLVPQSMFSEADLSSNELKTVYKLLQIETKQFIPVS